MFSYIRIFLYEVLIIKILISDIFCLVISNLILQTKQKFIQCHLGLQNLFTLQTLSIASNRESIRTHTCNWSGRLAVNNNTFLPCSTWIVDSARVLTCFTNASKKWRTISISKALGSFCHNSYGMFKKIRDISLTNNYLNRMDYLLVLRS